MQFRLRPASKNHPVQIPEQGFQGNPIRLRAVSNGVVGGDVTAGALQPMTDKDENRLGMFLDDFLNQVTRSDLLLQPSFIHPDLTFQAPLVSP